MWAEIALGRTRYTIYFHSSTSGQLWRQSTQTKKKKKKADPEMFGRVRAASSTLDCLELEKPPSKLIRDDSFSIYEVTLMKLKLGSQCDLGSPPDIDMERETACSCMDAKSSHCSGKILLLSKC
ncbi:hypothetical protein Patl1_18235 [Pistacia atlantica]|uniref:Uncharacterized protein n=1 Tax=Pistacia atlantica TaxID=434234 RepID=A0ACC1C2F9_9ROSI|nr:hypothetical protein Patl1_18235 [Pistacia atlantica]